MPEESRPVSDQVIHDVGLLVGRDLSDPAERREFLLDIEFARQLREGARLDREKKRAGWAGLAYGVASTLIAGSLMWAAGMLPAFFRSLPPSK